MRLPLFYALAEPLNECERYTCKTNQMTRITEATDKIIQATLYELGIEGEDITAKCSRRDIVDARQIVVYTLSTQGFTTNRIAAQMCVSLRYVQQIVAHFPDRIRYDRVLRASYERIANQVSKTSA